MSFANPPRPGRGAVSNPEGRFETRRVAPVDDGWSSDAEADELPPLETTLTAEHAKRVISRNDSPDVGFEQSINPYRGCEHGCIYCYARPSHSYVNLSPGLDFETKIFFKAHAAQLLETELRKPGANWTIQDQGTFAPQPAGATTDAELVHRWMASAAMDRKGNIAIGYSIVNGNSTNGQEIFPGLRYTGRHFNDPAGTLPQPEQTILDGTNSQGDTDANVEPQRWGDYSAMSVDPTDDCTFWFTSHVAGAGGTGARPTRNGKRSTHAWPPTPAKWNGCGCAWRNSERNNESTSG